MLVFKLLNSPLPWVHKFNNEYITHDVSLDGVGRSAEQVLSHVSIVAVIECVDVSQVVGPGLRQST
jgi:hypothetical protein